MTMNKILLVLIVSSGFLLIFYANNDIFTRKKWISIFQAADDDDDQQQKVAAAVEPAPVTAAAVADHKHRPHKTSKALHHSAAAAAAILLNHHHPATTNNFNDIKRTKYVPAARNQTEYNIFIIYTKENYLLKTKLEMFMKSLLKYASVRLHLHIISDERSESGAESILRTQIQFYKSPVAYTMYNVDECAGQLTDITQAMMPYFSSNPGSYYSDALFYLSLGLHRIVDVGMRRAILIDCDVVFRSDIAHLFQEFNKYVHSIQIL